MGRLSHSRFLELEEQAQGPKSQWHIEPEFFVNIVGHIQWRPGEGMLQDIPCVLAGVNEDIGALTLSWQDGEDSVVISLTKPEFELYEQRGDIVRVAA